MNNDDKREYEELQKELAERYGVNLPLDMIHAAYPNGLPPVYHEKDVVKLTQPYGTIPAGTKGEVTYSPPDGGKLGVKFYTPEGSITVTIRAEQVERVDVSEE